MRYIKLSLVLHCRFNDSQMLHILCRGIRNIQKLRDLGILVEYSVYDNNKRIFLLICNLSLQLIRQVSVYRSFITSVLNLGQHITCHYKVYIYLFFCTLHGSIVFWCLSMCLKECSGPTGYTKSFDITDIYSVSVDSLLSESHVGLSPKRLSLDLVVS